MLDCETRSLKIRVSVVRFRPWPPFLGFEWAALAQRPEQFHLTQEVLTSKAVSRAPAELIPLSTQSVVLVGRHRYGGHFHWQ